MTRRRWLLTRLPWYVASGLLFAFLLGVGLVLIHNAWTGDFLSFLGDGPRRAMEASQGVAAPADGETSRWNLEYSSFLWNDHPDPWLSGLLFALGAVLVLAVYFREGRNIGVGIAPARWPACASACWRCCCWWCCRSCASGTSARAGRTWRSSSTIRRA